MSNNHCERVESSEKRTMPYTLHRHRQSAAARKKDKKKCEFPALKSGEHEMSYSLLLDVDLLRLGLKNTRWKIEWLVMSAVDSDVLEAGTVHLAGTCFVAAEGSIPGLRERKARVSEPNIHIESTCDNPTYALTRRT
jgi:hypothetical protein